jgi:molecular chaperone GrpE
MTRKNISAEDSGEESDNLRRSSVNQDDDSQISFLNSQISELTEALQRERADAVNLRRRHEEQVSNLKNIVKANVVRELLPVIDNFERAMKHVPKDSNHESRGTSHEESSKMLDWIEGVKKILSQFEKTLANLGVEKIKTVGEPFDPKYHEAVSVEEGDPSTGSGQVAQEVVSEELQSGYKIGNDVIRHAVVRVKVQ